MIEYNKKIKLALSLVNGYVYFCDKLHPLANSQGYVYYHRHVASMKQGHWLDKNEHVHHVDGNKKNNSAENLMVLSPSEHAKLEHALKGEIKKIIFCDICGKELTNAYRKSIKNLCITCSRMESRKFHITKEELYNLVWKYPTTTIAKMHNVTDKAIEKRCKLFGISKPARGYWQIQKYKGESK